MAERPSGTDSRGRWPPTTSSRGCRTGPGIVRLERAACPRPAHHRRPRPGRHLPDLPAPSGDRGPGGGDVGGDVPGAHLARTRLGRGPQRACVRWVLAGGARADAPRCSRPSRSSRSCSPARTSSTRGEFFKLHTDPVVDDAGHTAADPGRHRRPGHRPQDRRTLSTASSPPARRWRRSAGVLEKFAAGGPRGRARTPTRCRSCAAAPVLGAHRRGGARQRDGRSGPTAA